jgi:hypothetical protein
VLGPKVRERKMIALDVGAEPPVQPGACSSVLLFPFEAFYYFTYASAVGRGPASGRFDPG